MSFLATPSNCRRVSRTSAVAPCQCVRCFTHSQGEMTHPAVCIRPRGRLTRFVGELLEIGDGPVRCGISTRSMSGSGHLRPKPPRRLPAICPECPQKPTSRLLPWSRYRLQISAQVPERNMHSPLRGGRFLDFAADLAATHACGWSVSTNQIDCLSNLPLEFLIRSR
jgi:hypothetical protein